MTEMRNSYFCRILAPPNAPSPPLTPKYLTILMTERGGAIVFGRILATTLPPDATILNYLTDREGAGITFSRILAPPNVPPPSPDTTILNYLNDREGGGRHYIMQDFAPPIPQTPQYLTILMTVRGVGAPIFCKKLNI